MRSIRIESDDTALKHQLLSGGGDLGARMRAIEWSETSLGPVQRWPQSLRTCVRIMLTSRQAMFVWWGDELINLYNDAYRSILGGKHPQALGQPASVVWHEIWNEVGPRAETAMKTEEGTYDEALLLIMERNGYPEETYYTFSYSPVPNDLGGTGGIICANTDDTQRILGARQLKLLSTLAGSTTNARTSLEACELGAQALKVDPRDLPFAMIYLLDEDRKAARLAASAGVVAGHPIAPSVVPLTGHSSWPFAEALRAHVPLNVVNLAAAQLTDLPTGAWENPPTQAAVLPLAGSGQDGQAGALIVGLSPFRLLDENYREFLSLVAGQISSSLANAQAYEDQKKRAAALAELDRAKTAFFSNVSHELRTPLTLMLGPIEDSLSDQRLNDETRERVHLLHRSALRLLKLVNALLDFSRIEAGRVQASYEPVDLASFTAELASVFQSAVERAGLKLVIETAPLPEPVFIDRDMWEKIVLNLLSNALKSTFEGEITVSVRDLGTGAELQVTDTGTGIPESEIPHLFERFRRVEGARRRTHEGSGIGLALVHELVEMHGGTIGLESTLGAGTTFKIFIPFGKSHLPQEKIRTAGERNANAIGATAYLQEALSWLPGSDALTDDLSSAIDLNSLQELSADEVSTETASRGGRVLLVDDNRDMREYVRRLLSRRFQVSTATNGKEALERAIANPPDLVLSDVMMPEMDGFQLLAALRENPQTRTVPVVLLSARAGEESRIEGLQAGADDYLVKPFTSRELMARVDAHIRIAQFRREALEHEAYLQGRVEEVQRLAAEAVEQIKDGFWSYDHDLRITYMNAAAEQMARRPRAEQVGHTIVEIFPELEGSEVVKYFERAQRDRLPAEFEYYFEPWQRWFAHRVYPTSDGGIVVNIRDITEAKKTEQALRRAEQLAAAGRLAASISHELNNPLEAVTNLLYLAKGDPSLSGNAKELLDIADKELQRLSHIASKSLKFYRQTSAPSRAYLSDILDSVLFFYEARMKSAGVTVEKRYDHAPPVMCYPGEMQQVFTNLISNALDAMPGGGKLLLAVRGQERTVARVTVADTGSGISTETRRHLFQPFFTTKEEAGTGLGLWVSQGILQKHRAKVRIRSKLGQGTAFSLFVPVDAAIGTAAGGVPL